MDNGRADEQCGWGELAAGKYKNIFKDRATLGWQVTHVLAIVSY
jgi:hypothetical protein